MDNIARLVALSSKQLHLALDGASAGIGTDILLHHHLTIVQGSDFLPVGSEREGFGAPVYCRWVFQITHEGVPILAIICWPAVEIVGREELQPVLLCSLQPLQLTRG